MSQRGVSKVLTWLSLVLPGAGVPKDNSVMSSGRGYPFDLLLSFREAPDGVPTFTGCQEDTQTLGLRTQLSVGEQG